MKILKRVFILLVLIMFVIIAWFGIEDIAVSYLKIKKINNEGIEATAVITKKWRGKCGSGYGNSATFVTNIEGKEYTFTSTCNVPNEVEVGNRYYVKYLKEDPSKNLILFDKKAAQ